MVNFLDLDIIKNFKEMHAKSFQSCLTLCDPVDCSRPGSSVHGDSPGKSTGLGCYVLLQGVLLAQRLNLCLLCLLHWQALMPPGKPFKEMGGI